MCVRRRPIGNRLTQNRVTDIDNRHMAPAYRAPAAVYGEYGSPYPAQPVYVERAHAYPERHYAPERRYTREPYYTQDRYYGEGRDYALEYAPRPPASVPYRSRARCDDGYGRLTYCD